MKKLLFFILAFLCAYESFAQMNTGLFGNEWINYQQSYYKMKVTADGLHRVSRQALQQSGVNVNNLNAANIQIFHEGREIPVYVQVNGSTLEYIEFYGKKNRGAMDANLYANPNHHFNPEYSVITDTAAYFLTWNNNNNGRRYTTSNTDLLNLPAKENFFWYSSMVMPDTAWQSGKKHNISGDLLSKSSFEYGEGWGSASNTSQTIQIATPYVYANGPAAIGKVRGYAEGNVSHILQIKTGNTLSFSTSFFGDSVGTHSFNIPLNLLSTNTAISVLGLSGGNDKHSVSYTDILYPRSFNFGGSSAFYFKIAASNTRKYLEINNFSNPGGAQNIYLYDITNGLRIRCFWDGSRVQTDLAPSATERELVLVNLDVPASYNIIGRVEAVQFNNFAPINGNYIIVAHSNMFNDGQGNNPVLEYAAYRSSTGFNVVVVNVQEIFDQFGYGINMHPQAMRNFASFIKQSWTAPQYIFLVGKGRVYTSVRNFNTYDHLIPTFGFPPSDNLLLAQGNSNIPVIPVGRLAITEGSELATYLQKIKDVEALQNGAQTAANKGWMKNIAHLGGGINTMEQTAFGAILNNLKSSVEGGEYGASVHSFFRKVQAPADNGNSTRLDSLIDSGTALITYLGHSTENSFDFDAYSIQKYNNYKKYPLFLSLSCSNGSVFGNQPMMSEQFVLSPNSGAAAFIGFVSPVSLSAANYYSTEFYRLLANEGYGKGSGLISKLSAEHLADLSQYSLVAELAVQYLIFHGDPAFKIQAGVGADYYVEPTSIHSEPTVVTAQMESFDLTFDLYNLGKALDTTFQVALYRILPNGDSLLVANREIAAPFSMSKISFKVPVGGIPAVGVNNFFLKLDNSNRVAELPNPSAENNNTANFTLQIIQSEVKPVFPAEFAMVPTTDVTLMASTGNAFAPVQSYLFEIDTTISFDSPLMASTVVTQGGGLLSWNPGINYLDSTVYYWRVRSLESSDEGNISSFMYKAGETGWNQSHVYQFKKDVFNAITLSEEQRQFNYTTSFQEVSVTNAFTPNVLAAGYVATFFNGNLSDKCRCDQENGVYVQVIDPNDFSIWNMPGNSHIYGAINCDPANRPSKVFLFKTDNAAGYNALENFLRDTIPAGFYVLAYTLNNAHAAIWPNSLLNLFETNGSTQVRNLAGHANGLPWIFFYKKGTIDYPHNAEVLAANENEIISLSCLMADSWYKGSVASTIIGPVKGWDFIDWIQEAFDPTAGDQSNIDVFGINDEGISTRLFNNITDSDASIAVIDALEYPFLQLVWNNADSINKTAPQLDFWRVSAEFLPELALRPDMFQTGHNDTLKAGEMFNFSVMMQNISETDMDSVLVKYQLIGGGDAVYHRVGVLNAGDTMRSPLFTMPTENLAGKQQVLVEINPDKDQPEMYHFNNVVLVDFYILDKRHASIAPERVEISNTIATANAEINVLFDNVKIQNGDVVSSTPKISIDLKTDSNFQHIKSLADFNISLKHPDMPNGRIYLDSASHLVQSIRLNIKNNGSETEMANTELTLHLNLPWDGLYSFEVNNKHTTAIQKYNVDFVVELEENPMVISANYPNPFKSETRFMFNIGEDLVPETVIIQITDLSGQIVREIGNTELGTLQTGLNQPGFAWDATDQSGTALPAGTYFYTITAEDANGNVKTASSVGKMLLIN